MNRILEELVRRTVAGDLTPLEAMELAWTAGIKEGIARGRVEKITHDPGYGCSRCGTRILTGDICERCAGVLRRER